MRTFIISCFLGIFLILTPTVFAEVLNSSNTVCTKVGNATGECKNIIPDRNTETPPTTTDPTGNRVSCPLKGKRTIGCGSFMSDPKYNRAACAGVDPVDRGHCGKTYTFGGGGVSGTPGCWTGDIASTKLRRWANSIDIDAPAGETGYAPTINGRKVKWEYIKGSSYDVPDWAGGGWGHGFIAIVGNDKWIMFTVHMNANPIPPPNDRDYYESGDPIVSVAATSYTHMHFNIGKNVKDYNADPNWLAPESTGACTD